jgi:hypothetical protein
LDHVPAGRGAEDGVEHRKAAGRQCRRSHHAGEGGAGELAEVGRYALLRYALLIVVHGVRR